MADGILSPCNVACGYGIMTLNSPSGSTLQCGTWLKDDMPLNSPGGTLRCGTWLWDHDIEFASWQHPTMWHVALRWHANEFAQTSDWKSTSGFDFDHYHTAVDVSFWTNLRNSIQIGPPRQKKITSCQFSRRRISAILDCGGPVIDSLKSPYTTSYRSSIYHGF